MRCVPPLPSPRRLAPALMIALAALSVGACGNTRYAQDQQPAWAGAESPPVAYAAVAKSKYVPEPGDPIKDSPVEPLRRHQAEPDDPREPFSPNYGSQPQRAQADAVSPADFAPAPVPDASRASARRRMVVTAGAD